MSEIWTQFFLQPMLNALMLLYGLVGQNFALAIAIFTIIIRLITLPLTLPQQKSAKKMAALQPELKVLQKKYKDDKEKLAKAQMELYKTAGVNPLGGCLPLLIQFPIWIGLYQSISQALGAGPLQLLNLSNHLYRGLPWLSSILPVKNQFLWLDLGKPDPLYILPIIVVATTWFQQKVMTAPSADAQSASMNQTMQIMMPLMLGFFSMQFASGLALYFIISNLVGVTIQYFTPGWVGFSLGRFKFSPATATAGAGAQGGTPSMNPTPPPEESDEGPADSEEIPKKGQRYGKKRRKRRG